MFGLSSRADLPETEALDVATAVQSQTGATPMLEVDKDQITIDSVDDKAKTEEPAAPTTDSGEETV